MNWIIFWEEKPVGIVAAQNALVTKFMVLYLLFFSIELFEIPN